MRALLLVGSVIAALSAPQPITPVKTAVLVHGFHLEAPNWEEVVWGGGGGRIGYGARLAHALGAELLIVGSGASARVGGENEGAAALRVLAENEPDAAVREVAARAEIDGAALCTREELVNAAARCAAGGVDRLYCVTSPAHCPRVARDAVVAFRGSPTAVFVAPAETDFADAAVVAVLEPPHRPDRPPSKLHAVASRALALDGPRRAAFESFAATFLDELENRDGPAVEEEAPLGPPPSADQAGDLAARAKAFFGKAD